MILEAFKVSLSWPVLVKRTAGEVVADNCVTDQTIGRVIVLMLSSTCRRSRTDRRRAECRNRTCVPFWERGRLGRPAVRLSDSLIGGLVLAEPRQSASQN